MIKRSYFYLFLANKKTPRLYQIFHKMLKIPLSFPYLFDNMSYSTDNSTLPALDGSTDRHIDWSWGRVRVGSNVDILGKLSKKGRKREIEWKMKKERERERERESDRVKEWRKSREIEIEIEIEEGRKERRNIRITRVCTKYCISLVSFSLFFHIVLQCILLSCDGCHL